MFLLLASRVFFEWIRNPRPHRPAPSFKPSSFPVFKISLG